MLRHSENAWLVRPDDPKALAAGIERLLNDPALAARLGKLIQCDCYVKWYRAPSYYSRPIKGSWETEGGGALINQAIHTIDLLLWCLGPVRRVFGRIATALHPIEAEDTAVAVVEFVNGAIAEATFNFYFKLRYQKTFDAILSTPLSAADISLPLRATTPPDVDFMNYRFVASCGTFRP